MGQRTERTKFETPSNSSDPPPEPPPQIKAQHRDPENAVPPEVICHIVRFLPSGEPSDSVILILRSLSKHVREYIDSEAGRHACSHILFTPRRMGTFRNVNSPQTFISRFRVPSGLFFLLREGDEMACRFPSLSRLDIRLDILRKRIPGSIRSFLRRLSPQISHLRFELELPMDEKLHWDRDVFAFDYPSLVSLRIVFASRSDQFLDLKLLLRAPRLRKLRIECLSSFMKPELIWDVPPDKIVPDLEKLSLHFIPLIRSSAEGCVGFGAEHFPCLRVLVLESCTGLSVKSFSGLSKTVRKLVIDHCDHRIKDGQVRDVIRESSGRSVEEIEEYVFRARQLVMMGEIAPLPPDFAAVAARVGRDWL